MRPPAPSTATRITRRHRLRQYPFGDGVRIFERDDVNPTERLVEREDLAVRHLGLPEPRHPSPGILQRQHGRALHVALRSFELLRRDPTVANIVDLPAHQRHHLIRLRWRRACVGAEDACLGVLGVVAVGGVGQSALLPDLLEQAR
jgi:hypothetical protein